MTSRKEKLVLRPVAIPAAMRDRMLAENTAERPRLISITLESLLPTTEIADYFSRSVARSALAAWPHWYDGQLAADFALSQASDTGLTAAIAAAGWEWQVSPGWLRHAIVACSRGHLPLQPNQEAFDQLCQLALVFGRRPRLLVTVLEESPAPERLNALGGFLATLADKTSFQVDLIVAASLADSVALDHVNYGVVPAATIESPAVPEVGVAAEDEPPISLSAEAGRPHPESPGEQLLAGWLAREQSLGPLFRFNQTVDTVRASKYRVDLLWQEGRVVVEVDGHRTHTTPHQFRFDRQRDYELAMSGYLVLRLTHQEVMQDVALAGEKIRDFVSLRQPGDGSLKIP